jgi:hypothetical protein
MKRVFFKIIGSITIFFDKIISEEAKRVNEFNSRILEREN